VHLSWPRGDLRRTVERHPSRWLDDLVSAAGSSGRTVTRVSQPSHLGALAAGTAASPGDQRLALALAEPDALAGADPRFAAGRRAVIARRQPFATAYDGNLGDEDLTPLQQRVWTASELEQYLDCPRTFFVRYVLGVRDDEPVDELLTADARREGTVIHRALQTVMIGERDAPPTDRPTLRAAIDDALTRAEHDAAQRSIANGQAPATVPALIARHRRRSLLGRLNKVVDEDRTRRTDGGRQVHLLEHGFGFDEPVAVTLPSGRPLAMKGRIDRIDRRPDGSAVVIDYKRRSRPDGSHVLGGRGRLQVAMYAAAARQVFGADEVGAELVSVADARIHTVDGATLAATGPLVELIVDAVEAARFWPPQHPPRGPGVPSCSICDPYGLFDRLLAHRARAAPT
jgi:RecB family exonuclease